MNEMDRLDVLLSSQEILLFSDNTKESLNPLKLIIPIEFPGAPPLTPALLRAQKRWSNQLRAL